MKSEKNWKRKFDGLQQSVADNAAAAASTSAQQPALVPALPAPQSIIDIQRFAQVSSEAGSPTGLAKELAMNSNVSAAQGMRVVRISSLNGVRFLLTFLLA